MTHKSSVQMTLLGIPLDLGAENLGVDIGPDAFRHHGIIEKLTKAGIQVTDKGDVAVAKRETLNPGNPKLRYLDEIVRVSEESALISEEVIRSGQRCIAIGGDHSINLGVVAGASTALSGDLGLIYLDAHGDMNTDETSPSGNIHGMHLASLLGHGAPALAHVHGDQVKIAKEKLLHIGGCDFDDEELAFMRKENIQAYTLFDMLAEGISPLLKKIDALAQRTSNIWISLDLDVIDAVYAPAAAMPNRRGLTYREISLLAEYIGSNCNVVGIDVVEYNPLRDVDNKTAELGIELIARFLGKNYSWYTNYLENNRTDK